MAEPIPIETSEIANVYDPTTSKWHSAFQAIFRAPSKCAAIDVATAAAHTIIPGIALAKIRIQTIFFTTSGEVNITLYDGDTAISGPMDFGGTSEPRGIVIPFPYSPLELSEGADFKINLSEAAQVSGTVCYYYQ